MKKKTTQQRILQHALELASVRGIEGIRLGPLAAQAHLSKSGLFAHFRSREDLQLQLLDTAADVFHQEVIRPAAHTPQGLPRLRALVGLWLGWAPRSGLPGGCPFVAAAADLDDREGPVREQLVLFQKRRFTTFQQFVEQAVTLGHLRADLDVVQFTWEVFGMYLMHHTWSRLLRDPDADQHAHTAFEALVAAAQPTEP